MRSSTAAVASFLLLLLLSVACGGENGEPAAIPPSGATVCEGLKKAERFRYVFVQIIESPRQANPDETVRSEFVNQPGSPDLKLSVKHDGVFVGPQAYEYEISVLEQPAQAPARKIRIGENEWVRLGDTWQVVAQPAPFPFAPQSVCDLVVAPLDLSSQAAQPEDVGDTEAQRIHLSQVPLPVSEQLFGPASDMGRLLKTYDVDIWLSEKKAELVKVDILGKTTYPFGRELSVRITLDLGPYNEKGIEIEPPV